MGWLLGFIAVCIGVPMYALVGPQKPDVQDKAAHLSDAARAGAIRRLKEMNDGMNVQRWE